MVQNCRLHKVVLLNFYYVPGVVLWATEEAMHWVLFIFWTVVHTLGEARADGASMNGGSWADTVLTRWLEWQD